MVISKAFVLSLLVSFLVLHLVQADEKMTDNHAAAESAQKIDCGPACKVRCSLSSRPNLCNRACGTCCARCNCVPPGTSGNREVCSCYATMTTHGGRLKCP